VFAWGFDVRALELLLERLVLLLRQVLVEERGVGSSATLHFELDFGGHGLVLVDDPLAGVECAFVVEAQGRAGVEFSGLHDV